MRLPPARVDAFLRRPDPEIRAVLLYGPDAGLARERADLLGRAVCPDLQDAFRVATLTGAGLAADPARLADEAAQISLMGGRRLVRVRDAADSQAAIFSRFLAGSPGDALVVVEAGDVAARGALRRLFEESAHAAAIGCYPDTARDLAQVIRDTLAAHRITASRDATEFLQSYLGADRLMTRAELDKLALYAGDGATIDLDDARAAIADSAALSLDDAIIAAASGEADALDRALARVFQEGEAPVTVMRAMLRHLQRLHGLAARVAAGETVDAVLRGARPPIFFKHQDSFRRQLGLWGEAGLRRALDAGADAEARLKTTGLPAETVCRAALLQVAATARRAARSPRPQ